MDVSARIHITGASGAGVTTLGSALSLRLGAPQFDVDDFFWLPTDPPFSTQRPVGERLALLAPRLDAKKWILSGSLVGWGDPFMPLFDVVMFIYAPHDVRMARLRARETARFGDAIETGGAMQENSKAFLDGAPAMTSRILAAVVSKPTTDGLRGSRCRSCAWTAWR